MYTPHDREGTKIWMKKTKDWKECVTYSVFTLIFLIKYTTLFGKKLNINGVKDLLKNEDVLFIGSLILKFYKRGSLERQGRCEESPIDQKEVLEKGFDVFPINSSINHSCNPNAVKVMTRKGKAVLYAHQPIERNSQV